MMTRAESEITLALKNFGMVTEESVESSEKLLDEVSENRCETLILPLMLSLDDECEFDELMFGVIHCLEKFPLEPYLRVLAKNVQNVHAKAPRWCAVLHTRIMNSSSAYDDYLGKLVLAEQTSKDTMEKILRKLSLKDQFRDRCLVGLEKLELM
jgi:hypothetical protein